MATDTLHDRAQICSHGPKVCPENSVKLEQLYSEAFDHWNEQCTRMSSRSHTGMLKPRKHKVSSPNVYGTLSAASRESAVEALEKGHTAGYIQESEALEENFDMNSADAMDSLEPEESPWPRTAPEDASRDQPSKDIKQPTGLFILTEILLKYENFSIYSRNTLLPSMAPLPYCMAYDASFAFPWFPLHFHLLCGSSRSDIHVITPIHDSMSLCTSGLPPQ